VLLGGAETGLLSLDSLHVPEPFLCVEVYEPPRNKSAQTKYPVNNYWDVWPVPLSTDVGTLAPTYPANTGTAFVVQRIIPAEFVATIVGHNGQG